MKHSGGRRGNKRNTKRIKITHHYSLNNKNVIITQAQLGISRKKNMDCSIKLSTYRVF